MKPRTYERIVVALAISAYGLVWLLGWIWVFPYFVLKSLVIVARGVRIKLLF